MFDRPSKYLILVSWPGMAHLFPQADEYWSFKDDARIMPLYRQAEGARNLSDAYAVILRSLNENFRDVADWRASFKPFWNGGTTARLDEAQLFLPHVPSGAVLGPGFSRDLASRAGYKVFLWPSRVVESWRTGRCQQVECPQGFWAALCQRLLKANYVPVVWQSPHAYDLTRDCDGVFVGGDVPKVLAAARSCDAVLDVFNGLSRLAVAARTPFVALDERARHAAQREWEYEAMCSAVPCQHVFTFSAMATAGQSWEGDLFSGLINRLDAFLPTLARDDRPATGESLVPVRPPPERLNRRIGTRLFKVIND